MSPLFDKSGAVVHAHADRVEHQASPIHFIVALDSSGSMVNCFSSVKDTLISLYSAVAKVRQFASNTLYVFSDSSVMYDLTDVPVPCQAERVSSLKAGGGTNFVSVLTAIQEQIQAGPPKACYFIVFLTGSSQPFVGNYPLQCTTVQPLLDCLEDHLNGLLVPVPGLVHFTRLNSSATAPSRRGQLCAFFCACVSFPMTEHSLTRCTGAADGCDTYGAHNILNQSAKVNARQM